MRASLVLIVLVLLVGLAACTRDASEPPPPKIVLVADAPSHGPGEHEYTAGVKLLASVLARHPGVATLVVDRFPDDMSVFDGATAIVLQTNGRHVHPLLTGGRAGAFAKVLERGVGFTCIHWSTEAPPEIAPMMLASLGGHATFEGSVFEIWRPELRALPTHPATRGVAPFSIEDEFYYGLVLANDVTPILTAPRGGRDQTFAWTFVRRDGGRSFGYTGAHFHQNWGNADVRRLVVNAILWTAGLEVPERGADVELDPARLNENLDPK